MSRRRPNHSMIVSYLALFVALGGTAFAATKLTGADIADGSLSGADLRNGSVRSTDVKGITGNDLGPGAAWTLRSPDKRFSTAVTDAGAVLEGPGGKVTVDGSGVTIDGTGSVTIRSSGAVRVGGATVRLGNGDNCRPLADGTHVHNESGAVTSAPVGGTSTTVFVCGS